MSAPLRVRLDDKASLSEAFKSLRTMNNLTQNELAFFSKLSLRTVEQAEKGHRDMNVLTIQKLCKLYNCHIEIVFPDAPTVQVEKLSKANLTWGSVSHG